MSVKTKDPDSNSNDPNTEGYRRRQGRHSSEARSHQAPSVGKVDERQLLGEERDQLPGDEPGMRRVVRILDKAVAGRHERGDEWGDLAPVDEVVEDGLGRGVVQVVVAVVDDEQRIAAKQAEPCGPVEPKPLLPAKCLAT
jgi:hypothetical protein